MFLKTMREVLFQYYVDPTTWVYLSCLMTIGIYFKFRRFWSVRNLDLIGILAFGPGMLLIASPGTANIGYIWLFVVGGLFLFRMMIDPIMVRRPLLEPNLSLDGLTFTGFALFFFLIANAVTCKLIESDTRGAERMDQILSRQLSAAELAALPGHGPGWPVFQIFSTFSNTAFVSDEMDKEKTPPPRALIRAIATRSSAILAHLAIVIGIVVIGYRHFENLHTGMAVGALYLLLPYSSQMTSQVDHVAPAALIVWAIEAYRRPITAGILIGLAAGWVGYPIFLLPLWCSFYWRRGVVKFLIGVAIPIVLLCASLVYISSDFASFMVHLKAMLGVNVFTMETSSSFWSFHEPIYRIPVIVAFLVGCSGMFLWPAHKNLGTLLSGSTAVMLAIMFWYDPGTGIYHLGWFLPLLLLTIFRPNLEDRIAEATVY